MSRTPSEKHCPQCDQTKPADAFGRRSGKRRHQLQSYCRTCAASYRRDGDWSAVHIPASLHRTVVDQAAANGMGVGQFLSACVRETTAGQCARPGCVRRRSGAPHGLCGRCDAAVSRAADSRRTA